MATTEMRGAQAASVRTCRLGGVLQRGLAALRDRADWLRAQDELRRLPERTLADLGLRRTELVPRGERR